jgi:hypothetical protein
MTVVSSLVAWIRRDLIPKASAVVYIASIMLFILKLTLVGVENEISFKRETCLSVKMLFPSSNLPLRQKCLLLLRIFQLIDLTPEN